MPQKSLIDRIRDGDFDSPTGNRFSPEVIEKQAAVTREFRDSCLKEVGLDPQSPLSNAVWEVASENWDAADQLSILELLGRIVSLLHLASISKFPK